MKLKLPFSTFDMLFSLANGRGKMCQVPREDLVALMMDHSRAVAALVDAGVEVEDDYAACDQVRNTARKRK